MVIKLLVAAFMLSILICLACGIKYLLKEQQGSKRMVKALSWRIGLSLSLFMLLLILYALGYLAPHFGA
jgi:ABC-type antimicrobial peptide transport system permease subunit